jgi:hypothetical protein
LTPSCSPLLKPSCLPLLFDTARYSLFACPFQVHLHLALPFFTLDCFQCALWRPHTMESDVFQIVNDTANLPRMSLTSS